MQSPYIKTKTWYESKTVIGSIAVVISSVLHILDLDIAPGPIEDVVTSLGTLAGGLLGIWGRVTATQPIGKSK